MLTLAGLANTLNGVWHGNANHAIFSFASLSRATSKDITYFDNPVMQPILDITKAGAVLLKPEHKTLYSGNYIIVANPAAAMQHVALLLEWGIPKSNGVHDTVQIDFSAEIGKHVSIGPNSIIGAGVILEDGVRIGANTIIESAVYVAKGSDIGSAVVIHSGTRIGTNTLINSGCIIGATPFNYLKEQGVWKPGFAMGGVVIADGVQIGANTVIDRGALGDTYLAVGVCIDNLVQIAHDVCIGRHTAIAGCAAIGAQVQIGADCIIGGASSIAPYVTLADDVVITGMSTVNKSIKKSGIYSSGTLINEHQRWRRNATRFKRLDDYIAKLSALERKIIK